MASLCFWWAEKCPNPSLIEGLTATPILPHKQALVKTNWLAHFAPTMQNPSTAAREGGQSGAANGSHYLQVKVVRLRRLLTEMKSILQEQQEVDGKSYSLEELIQSGRDIRGGILTEKHELDARA